MHRRGVAQGLFFLLLLGVYLATFATLGFEIPEYPDWLFGADTREHILKGNTEPFGRQVWMAKHPAFAVLARPVFWLGTWIFEAIVSSPWSENLPMTFQASVYGVASVAVAYALFVKSCPDDKFAAVIFAVLMGFSTTWWVFSSFPESFALTSALSVFAFIPLAYDLDDLRVLAIQVALCALACWGTPQVFWLLAIPSMYFLVHHQLSWKTVKGYATITVVFACLYAIPYYVLLRFNGVGTTMPQKYTEAWLYYAPIYTVQVPFNLYVTSVVGPAVPPVLYSTESFEMVWRAPWWWYPCALAFVAFAGWTVVNARRSPAWFSRHFWGIAAFLIGYTAMFNVFNPRESFLYTMQSLFAWVLLMHTGFCALERRRSRPVAVVVTSLVVVNSLATVLYLRSIANPVDLGELSPEEQKARLIQQAAP